MSRNAPNASVRQWGSLVLALNAAPAIAQDDAPPDDPEPSVPIVDEANDDPDLIEDFDASEDVAAASNPLASVSKLDLRFDYFDLDGSRDRVDFNLKGDLMVHPRVKLIYEAHYWITDATGKWEDDLESVRLKPIAFLKDTKLEGDWQMRVAAGVEWIISGGNEDKGIGDGADQIAPLFGLAFNNRESGLTLVPLIQHFQGYDGPDVETTSLRLIALQPLPDRAWLRLDAKIPFDWENNTVPAVFETELGKMISPNVGVFTTFFVGIGADRPYDWGIGPAIRLRF